MTLTLTSADFTAGGPIPAIHTCDGANKSPALSWSGAPPDTKSLVLIVDDPDAPDPAAPQPRAAEGAPPRPPRPIPAPSPAALQVFRC